MSTTTIKPAKQRGTVIVEFAIVGVLFFTLLLGVLEAGRLAYTWNSLAEATRLGARAAAVCGVNTAVIKTIVRFNDQLFSPTELTAANIEVRYLNSDSVAVVDPAGAGFGAISFAQVNLANYTFTSVIPGLSLTFPAMTSTRPRESLGFVPLEGADLC